MPPGGHGPLLPPSGRKARGLPCIRTGLPGETSLWQDPAWRNPRVPAEILQISASEIRRPRELRMGTVLTEPAKYREPVAAKAPALGAEKIPGGFALRQWAGYSELSSGPGTSGVAAPCPRLRTLRRKAVPGIREPVSPRLPDGSPAFRLALRGEYSETGEEHSECVPPFRVPRMCQSDPGAGTTALAGGRLHACARRATVGLVEDYREATERRLPPRAGTGDAAATEESAVQRRHRRSSQARSAARFA